MGSAAGDLIARARRRAGLSQRALAQGLSTSQSLVARWESGEVVPSFDTVLEALRSCGFDLDLSLHTYDRDHDIQIDRSLRLSPEDRLRKLARWNREVSRLKASTDAS